MSELEEALKLIEEFNTIKMQNRITTEYGGLASEGSEGGPYDWQALWHDMGVDCPERAIIAGNRTGKTRTASAEVALHLTGLYPDWWQGRRFDEPTSWIVAGPTNELTRDVCQFALVNLVKMAVQIAVISSLLIIHSVEYVV